MISFCGYNFFMDEDSLNPFPTHVTDLQSVTIQNAVYDHINIEKNINTPYNTELPLWNMDTILDCNFDKGIGAGNVDFSLSQLTSVKIKRRKKGTFKWITIRNIFIKSPSDFSVILKDYFVPSFEDFEYALVPVLNGIEGEYIKGFVSTDFNGVFISDVTQSFKLDKGVSYGNRSSIQEVGQLTPLGRRYPVIIKNGESDYEVGSVSGTLLGENYDKNHTINRKEIVEHINKFIAFLKNGKPKFIRDWNGSIYLVYITGNPSVTYNNNYGMGVAQTSFEWIEQGKYDDEDDLYNNGFLEIVI